MDKQWSDNGAPLVSPDAKFRQELARALQDTHHRQRVQRQLYSSPSTRHHQPTFWTFLGAISLLMLFFGLGYYIGRKTP